MHILKKALLVFMLLFAVTACDGDDKNTRTIILGTSPDYPPFEYKQKGDVVGYDIDVAKKIAGDLGYKIEIKEMDFDSLIPALKVGKIDFAMSGLTVSKERLKNVDFSTIYYEASLALITKKGAKIQLPKDMYNKTIGTQLGSTMEVYLKNQAILMPDMKVRALKNNMQLVQELKIGKVDGVLVEEVQAKSFVETNPELDFVVFKGTGVGYAVALQKNSPYTKEIDSALAVLEKEGELKLFKDKWILGNVKSNALIESLKYIPGGMVITLQYAIISVFFGFIIGSLLALFKVSGLWYLKFLADVYTSIFRGTPLLVQLSLAYFALPVLLDTDISAFTAGILAFSLNSGAYVSEIIRAGIQAVDKGQFEASKSLGIPYSLMMKKIILPQAIRKILPSLVNEMINLLKESAIISMIGEADLMRRAQVVAAEHYTYFQPILVAAACYYILVMILTMLAKILEKRLEIK